MKPLGVFPLGLFFFTLVSGAFFLSTTTVGLAQAASSAQAAEDDHAPIIETYQIVGQKRVDTEVIARALRSKKGEPFDNKKVTEDIKAIFATNLFRDVVVRRLPGTKDRNNVILIYQVTEKPSIRSINYEGNSEISNDDIKAVVDVRVGAILNSDQLAKNVGKIRELYVDKGFFLAEVTFKSTSSGKDEVDVSFVISENQKVQVKKITFLGNKNVTDEELKGFMQTREGHFLAFITGAGTYKDEWFQADLYRLTSVYYDRGFINAKVLKPQVQISADRRYIYITIPLEEGEQYSIGDIELGGDIELKDEAGNVLVRKEQLRERITFSKGEIFNRSRLFQDLQRGADLYRDFGYAYANVTPNTRIDPEKRIVNLQLDVERGDKVYFENIEITGNTKTRDKVIRRELRIYEGELFSGTNVEVSKQRVTALGFFEKVEITTERGSAANKMNVKVEIKERSTGTFQVGAGFSSVERFIATAQIAQQNFLGRGQNVSLQAQVSFGQYARQIFTFSFIEPYFLDNDLTFSFNLYWTTQGFAEFQRARRGGSIGFGYPLNFSGSWRAFLTYTLEHISIEGFGLFNTSLTRNLYNLNQRGIVSSIRADLQYDTRDNRLFPSRGLYDLFSVEFADRIIGSQFNFVRFTANSRFYQPLFLGVLFKAQAQVGYIFSRDAAGVPISERFFPGGIFSIRGFNPRSVGPRIAVPTTGDDPSSPTSAFVIGGDKELQLNLELEFPIFEKAGIRGVLFADIGNAYNNNQNFFYIGSPASNIPNVYLMGGNKPIKPPLGLLYSFGSGIRWFSPIGPLRFEWGIPVTKLQPLDRDLVFEFTIGNFF